MIPKIELNYKYTEKNQKLYSPLDGISNAVIFLPNIYGPFINHPLGYLINDPSFNSSIVYSRNLGDLDIQLMEKYKNRNYYMYQLEGLYTESYDNNLTINLKKLDLVEDNNIKINMTIKTTEDKKFLYAYILNNGNSNYYLLDKNSKIGNTYNISWDIYPGNITFKNIDDGKYNTNKFELTDSSPLIIGVAFSESISFSGSSEFYEYRYMLDLSDHNITLLVPPDGWKNEEYPDRYWTEDNISDIIKIR